jgi:predicted nicotinamide N-methyase
VLERDGLVIEKSVRRGPTKPTYEFSLTPEAEKLQHHQLLADRIGREPEYVRQVHRGGGLTAAEFLDDASPRRLKKAVGLHILP